MSRGYFRAVVWPTMVDITVLILLVLGVAFLMGAAIVVANPEPTTPTPTPPVLLWIPEPHGGQCMYVQQTLQVLGCERPTVTP